MSELATQRGDDGRAAQWAEKARALAEIVDTRFWLEDKGFYGIALRWAMRYRSI